MEMKSEILLVFILTIILLAFAFVALAIGIIVKKKGKFPNTHVGSNEALKKQGISCVKSFDRSEQQKAKQEKRAEQQEK